MSNYPHDFLLKIKNGKKPQPAVLAELTRDGYAYIDDYGSIKFTGKSTNILNTN